MPFLKISTGIALGSTASGVDSSAFSPVIVNGCLQMISVTTDPSTTGTITTTGNFLVKGSRTGITWLSIPMPAAGLTIIPRVRAGSSSGGVIGVGTTDSVSWYEAPYFAEEKIVFQTSGGSSAQQYAYRITYLMEGP